jgi:hypothetical protein
MRFSLNKTVIQENNKFSFNIKISKPGELVGEFVVGTNVVDLNKIQVANLTPMPAPIPTPISDIIYSFGDMPSGDNPVNGIHGGIDFGTEIWGAGNYFGFGSTSGWFLNSDFDSRSFMIPAGNRLKSIKLSTGIRESTWSISDNVNPPISGIFESANTPIIVATGWTKSGTNITITFSARWDSGINNITYGVAVQ